MDTVISIGATLCGYTVEPIGRLLCDMIHYETNLEDLRTQIEILKGLKVSREHFNVEATRNGEEIEPVVLGWMSRVDVISGRTEDLFTEDRRRVEVQGNTSGCFGVCSFPNLVLWIKLVWKLNVLASEVGREIEHEGQLPGGSYRPSLESSVPDVEGYVSFQSRESTFDQIMDAMRNPNLQMIGVYGMAGIGKTMLAIKVARRAKDEEIFRKCIVVTVSQSPKPEDIQQEIAEKLGLVFWEETIDARANRLRHRLSKEKNILIILDDVWEKLELECIGIHFGNDRKDCKMLLTSRSGDVLHKDMRVERNLPVGVLPRPEATSFFYSIAGDTIKKLGIQRLAAKIVSECAGLPIAIATVAKALWEKESVPVWSNALHELKVSAPANIKDMHEKVYSCIKLSYDFLRSVEAQSLLLLCSLFPEDANIEIEYLLRHGAGWGLFHRINKLEEARNKVVTLVDDLKTRCLLLNGDFENSVKMHDVIRDVAVSIASSDRHMHNFSDVAELEECCNDEKLKDSIALSVSEIDPNCQLPKSLMFPKAQVLLMRRSGKPFRYRSFLIYRHHQYPQDGAIRIPAHLFEEMKDLRVLELGAVCVNPLPSSFSFLQNLQTLCLWFCNIGEVAVIGGLRNLKILDLTGSNIEKLPSQIGQLNRLQLLDLKYCYSLEVIYPNIISRLTSLQELNMEKSFRYWDVPRNGVRSNASLVELKSLHLLTSLHVCVSDANILPKDIFSQNLQSYNIKIGNVDVYREDVQFDVSRSLHLGLKKSDVLSESGLKMLLKRSEALYLDGLEGLNDVVGGLDMEGFPQLKHLEFQNNDGIQYIVNSIEAGCSHSAFVSLELLHLDKLKNLKRICHGKHLENCFGKLREIRVDNCGKLKNLFPISVAKALLQLEKMEVSRCEMLEEIITCESEVDSQNIGEETVQTIDFPQLRTLTLRCIPQLVQFYSPLKTSCRNQREGVQLVSDFAVCPFNNKVTFPKLQNLTLGGSSTINVWHGESEGLFPGLRGLQLSGLPNLIHLWDENCHHTSRSISLNLMYLFVVKCKRLKTIAPSWISFQNLIILQVVKCDGMVNLFTCSMARSFAQLRMMSIIGCKSMTEIVTDEESEIGGHEDQIVFNQLVLLEMHFLPSLTRFYSGKLRMGFPKLKHLRFGHCPELRSFSHGVVSTPQLDKIALPVYTRLNCYYVEDMDLDRQLTGLNFADLDFDDMSVHDPVQELVNGDINTTMSQLWERDDIGLALRQLFTEGDLRQISGENFGGF